MSGDIVGLIPAAGVGRRLYPFSRAVPKEMYPILGKSVIEHCVESLKEGGIRRIFMVVGYQKGALMDYMGDGSLFGVRIAYLYQLERKGIGHAILQARDWINTTFVTLLGDSFIEPKQEIKTLIGVHQREKPLASLLLFRVKDPSGYGLAKVRRHGEDYLEVKKLIEKPTKKQAKPYLVGGGYYALCGAYVFEPGIFEYIKRTPPGRDREIQITDSLALAIEKGERVLGWELSGKYLDAGKWATVLQVEREFFQEGNLSFHIRDRERLAKKVEEISA